MADNSFNLSRDGCGFNDAICIDTKRIYDSCVSKDCLEDLRVTFFSCSQRLIDNAVVIKCRSCEIQTVNIDVEEVPFNHGFYSVDITFFFRLKFDTFETPVCPPQTAVGYATFSKKCILYGGDGNVRIFSSRYVEGDMDDQSVPQYTNPNAKVQVVDPVVLSTRVCEVQQCCEPCCCCLPKCITCRVDDELDCGQAEKAVLVTLGLFTIIQMERDVQMMVPAYDYCIPEKECCCNTDNPCDTFRKIQFPMDEFFPPEKDGCSCGCAKKEK